MTTTASLFDRIGGMPALEAAVPRFYAKVRAHPLLAPHFAHLSDARMADLEQRQVMLLAMVTGGPSDYDGDLTEAHAGMGIGDEHVTVVINLLVETLGEMGVHPALIAEVALKAEGARDAVLGR